MKRGAERQISKNDNDDADIEEIEPSEAGGFLKADDATLATRKIKPIPRRMGGDSDKPATPPPPKFSGFGTPGSSAFSFTPPSSSPTFPLAKPTPNPFAIPTTTTFSAAPAVAPTASNAAKTFASFLGNTSSPPSNPSPNSGAGGDSAELKYFKSLRGLNVSVLDFLQIAVEEDPFVDLGTVISEYSLKRGDIKKEFDGASAPAPSPFGGASAPAPSPLGGASVAPFKMPAAPTAFAGFGNLAPTTTKPNGTVDAPSVPPTTAFTFGGSASTSKPSVFTPPATSLFSSSSTTTTPSAFSFASPPTTAFGSSGASSTTAAPFGSAGSPSPFGGSKPTSSFLSNSASSGTGFTFGASLGNPVGFSFGSPKGGSSTPADTKSEGSGAEDGDGDETEAVTSQETEKTSTEGSKKTSSFFTSDVPSTMDAEGEGEEDEETVQAARIKAFRMKKKDEPGDTPWIDMGIGFVRLKKHKETAARRLLLRNSHSGKIQINFALFSGFSATLKSKTLLFVGHDDAANSQTYNLKFKTDADALDFQTALDKEVAQIKPK